MSKGTPKLWLILTNFRCVPPIKRDYTVAVNSRCFSALTGMTFVLLSFHFNQPVSICVPNLCKHWGILAVVMWWVNSLLLAHASVLPVHLMLAGNIEKDLGLNRLWNHTGERSIDGDAFFLGCIYLVRIHTIFSAFPWIPATSLGCNSSIPAN